MRTKQETRRTLINRRFLFAFLICALFLTCTAIFRPSSAWAMSESELAAVTDTGWQRLANGRVVYMVAPNTPAVGFKKIKKKYYHFDEQGYLSTGWFEANGYRYFAQTGGKLGKNLGRLKSGYKKVNGNYYLFSTKKKVGRYGRMQTGWQNVSGKIFYFSESGIKKTGLSEVGKNLYYFAENGGKTRGQVKTGWVTVNDKKYYFRTSGKVGKKFGAAYRGTTVKIKGTKYTFDANGVLAESKTTSAATGANAQFIEKIGALAHADMLATGVLASVTVAQAIVESNYGKSVLAVQANNLFGMKANLSGNWNVGWDGSTYTKKTLEYLNGGYVTISAKFRKYTSYSQSIADHSGYLVNSKLSNGSKRYAGIVGCRDYTKAARIIKNGGYATAPNYVSALVTVIEKFDLTRFD